MVVRLVRPLWAHRCPHFSAHLQIAEPLSLVQFRGLLAELTRVQEEVPA